MKLIGRIVAALCFLRPILLVVEINGTMKQGVRIATTNKLDRRKQRAATMRLD